MCFFLQSTWWQNSVEPWRTRSCCSMLTSRFSDTSCFSQSAVPSLRYCGCATNKHNALDRYSFGQKQKHAHESNLKTCIYCKYMLFCFVSVRMKTDQALTQYIQSMLRADVTKLTLSTSCTGFNKYAWADFFMSDRTFKKCLCTSSEKRSFCLCRTSLQRDNRGGDFFSRIIAWYRPCHSSPSL